MMRMKRWWLNKGFGPYLGNLGLHEDVVSRRGSLDFALGTL